MSKYFWSTCVPGQAQRPEQEEAWSSFLFASFLSRGEETNDKPLSVSVVSEVELVIRAVKAIKRV